VLPFIGLCLLLGAGHLLRMRIRLLRKLYLPSCVIGGLVGLIVVQCILATGAPLPDKLPREAQKTWKPGASLPAELDKWRPGDPVPKIWPAGKPQAGWPVATKVLVDWTAGWGKLPGMLINVVFACLFLGVKLPKVSTLWKRAGPQLAYGQVVAWGQYVVGVGLVLAVLGPLFGVPAMFGGIIPVGFEGGHGTAGGMGPVFEKLGWPEGRDFGLASATAGIVSAIIFGMILINWAARRGHTARRERPEDVAEVPEDDTIAVIPVDRRPSAGRLTVSADAIESFTLHLVVVGAAILIGVGMQKVLLALGALAGTETTLHKVTSSFPLFPLCMLGGLIVQVLEDRFDKHNLIDLGLTRRIQNSALDFLVVAAIATINLRALVPSLAPFLIIVLGRVVRALHRRDGSVHGRYRDGVAVAAGGGPGLRDPRRRRLRLQAAPARALHGRRAVDLGGRAAAGVLGFPAGVPDCLRGGGVLDGAGVRRAPPAAAGAIVGGGRNRRLRRCPPGGPGRRGGLRGSRLLPAAGTPAAPDGRSAGGRRR